MRDHDSGMSKNDLKHWVYYTNLIMQITENELKREEDEAKKRAKKAAKPAKKSKKVRKDKNAVSF